MPDSSRIGPEAGSSPVPGPHALRARLLHVVEQHPLLETLPSRHALVDHALVDGDAGLRARTVFAGIGLVSGARVTRALPFDVLGLLLSAEQVRRTLHAERLLVLVADDHGLCNGASAAQLDRRSAQYVELLRAIAQRCRFERMQVVRASDWQRDPAYRRTFDAVERRVPADTDPYVLRELADIAHVERSDGGVVKVGWALQRSRRGVDRDERLFDDAFMRFIGGNASFVYAKAGRAFDDRCHKVSPYVAIDVARRICIDPDENVVDKLVRARAAVSHSTFRGVCNHLKAVTRSYTKLVRPLHGGMPQRAQAVIDDLLDPEPRKGSTRPQICQSEGAA